MDAGETGRSRWHGWARSLAFAAVVVAAAVIAVELRGPITSVSVATATVLVRFGPGAATVLFALVFALATIVLLGGSLLTMVGGYVFAEAFGMVRGSVLCTVATFLGSTIGAVAAFLMARSACRSQVQAWTDAEGRDKIRIIDRAIGRHGFKLMLMLRMSPFVPFAVSNYTFGLMAVSLATYALACVGIIPLTIIEVVVGANVSGISNLFTASNPLGTSEIGILIFIVTATVLLLLVGVYVSFAVKKEIAKLVADRNEGVAAAQNQ